MAASNKESDNTWATLAHLSGFVGFVVPFGNIVAPLLIMLLKKADAPFASKEAKEALNFQISMTIYMVIAAILIIVLLGIILIPLLTVVDIVLMIMAAVSASKGVGYRYPFTIRFIK